MSRVPLAALAGAILSAARSINSASDLSAYSSGAPSTRIG